MMFQGIVGESAIFWLKTATAADQKGWGLSRMGFWEINSVDLLCVKITSLGEIAMEDNPTSQSVKQLGSVPKYMRTRVKPRVCFSIGFERM